MINYVNCDSWSKAIFIFLKKEFTKEYLKYYFFYIKVRKTYKVDTESFVDTDMYSETK